MSVFSKPEVLSVQSLLEIFNLRGLYILGYGWLLGMCKFCIRNGPFN